MNILLCGNQDDYPITRKIEAWFPNAKTFFCKNSEELPEVLAYVHLAAAMVTADGADGMEAVMLLRRQRPELPVVWLSDDSGFAMESYRLGTVYFHPKPLTKQIVSRALANCGLSKTGVS